ncbi:MAG: glutamine--fructose-6-phosphate aminotransferase, partial [Opitutales bacterium]|nr:glutamine--fructose-6-phosphate aminotransferase [Opitutales bacterium]
MCGIVGYIGNREASPILLEGLKRLEYRGYDSAGIAVLADDTLKLKKHKGRVTDLARNLNSSSVSGSLGISHTRWATHGSVTEANAHPHVSHDGKISLVHNGVIENYLSVKKFLESTGVEFYSETDSEVFCNLIAYHYQKESEASPTRFLDSVRRSLRHIVGTYGIAVICTD